MRRVLHLRSSGGMLGAEAVILQLATESSQHGYEAVIGAVYEARDGRPELLRVAESMGLATCDLPSTGRSSLSPVTELRKYVRSRAIDLIHTHGYREDILALLALPRTPRIATNHLWKRTTPRLRFYAWLDAWVLRAFPCVVAVSEKIADDMRRKGIDAGRILVIANGIKVLPCTDEEHARLRDRVREELQVAPSDVVVMMVSSLTVEKGHAIALSAMRLVAMSEMGVRLIVLGSGPLEEQLARLTRELSLTATVRFLGTRQDVSVLLHGADLFLMTSLNEGLPMALLEAMSAGLPVVATDVGEIRNVLADGAGQLVAVGEVPSIADAILDLARDKAARAARKEGPRQGAR